MWSPSTYSSYVINCTIRGSPHLSSNRDRLSSQWCAGGGALISHDFTPRQGRVNSARRTPLCFGPEPDRFMMFNVTNYIQYHRSAYSAFCMVVLQQWPAPRSSGSWPQLLGDVHKGCLTWSSGNTRETYSRSRLSYAAIVGRAMPGTTEVQAYYDPLTLCRWYRRDDAWLQRMSALETQSMPAESGLWDSRADGIHLVPGATAPFQFWRTRRGGPPLATGGWRADSDRCRPL